MVYRIGWETGIRTPIRWSRATRLTIRRSPSAAAHFRKTGRQIQDQTRYRGLNKKLPRIKTNKNPEICGNFGLFGWRPISPAPPGKPHYPKPGICLDACARTVIKYNSWIDSSEFIVKSKPGQSANSSSNGRCAQFLDSELTDHQL